MLKLLTVNETKNILKVSKMTIYRLLKRGKLKAKRVGGSWRIREDWLEKYLSQFDN